MHRKELCVTLIIYQESLHDARSTEYKGQFWLVVINEKLVSYLEFFEDRGMGWGGSVYKNVFYDISLLLCL